MALTAATGLSAAQKDRLQDSMPEMDANNAIPAAIATKTDVDTVIADLLSTSSGKGASQVGYEGGTTVQAQVATNTASIAALGGGGSTGFDAETTTVGGKLELYEGTDNGTNKVTMAAPNSLAANRAITVPDADVTLADIATNTASIAAATTDTGAGAGNAGKLVELDGDGKIDGRDLGVDGIKLDGIEALADVTDLTNVAAALAVTAAVAIDTSAGAGDNAKLAKLDASGLWNLNMIPVIDATKHGNLTGGALHSDAVAGVSAGFLSGADKTKLDGIEAAADITDETNVLAALAVGVTAKDMGGGAVTNVGNVDGRDVSADGTKLDGIETAADVTDLTNVAAALSVTATAAVVTSAGGGDDGKLAKLDPTGRWDISLMPETVIKEATVALSTANILALHTTPIELVPSPAAGLYNEFLGATVRATFNATALNDAAAQGNLRIKTGTSTQSLAVTEADGVVDVAAGTAVRHVYPAAPGATQDFTAQQESIVIDNDGGAFTDPGGADTTMSITTRYRVLSLA